MCLTACATFAEDGESITYEGEIFRAGEYADKGVSATPEDLTGLAADASPVIPAKIQHTDCAFDAALRGFGLEKVEAREGGTWLWGRVRLPKWVADALGRSFPVSLALSMEGRHPVRIEEISIVNEARIPTAHIAAALAAAQTSLQPARPLCPAKEPTMNLLEKARAFFRGNPEAGVQAGITEDDLADHDAAEHPDPALSAQIAAFEAQTTADRARVSAMEAKALDDRAAAFARDAIEVQRKALPSEAASLKGLFVMAATADGGGQARFAANGSMVEGEHLKIVRDSVALRRTLTLFESAIPDRADEPQGYRHQAAAALRSGAFIDAYNQRAGGAHS